MTLRNLHQTYEVLRQLGHGAMAEVLLARTLDDDKLVAIKRALPHLADDANIRARFAEEVRVMPIIHHPNIVRTIEIVDDDGAPAIVLEYIQGPSLIAIDRAARGMGRPLSPGAIAHIGGELLSALGYLHDVEITDGERGVVHRDVTPSNILMAGGGSTCLIDFGVAFAAGRESLTKTGALVGKVGYMAPEVLRGESVGPGTDIFATTVLIYELLCGASPYDGKTAGDVIEAVMSGRVIVPQKVAPWLSDDVNRLLLRGLSTKASDRFEDAWEMAMDLSDALPAPDATEIADMLVHFAPELAQTRRDPAPKTASAEEGEPEVTKTRQVPTETDPVAFLRDRQSRPDVTITQVIPTRPPPRSRVSRASRGSDAEPHSPSSTLNAPDKTVVAPTLMPDATETQVAPARSFPETDGDE